MSIRKFCHVIGDEFGIVFRYLSTKMVYLITRICDNLAKAYFQAIVKKQKIWEKETENAVFNDFF